MKKFISICLILTMIMSLSVTSVSAATTVKCERPLQFEENIATGLKNYSTITTIAFAY